MKANGNLEISPTSELDFCSNHIEVRCSIPPQGALPHHLAVTLKKHMATYMGQFLQDGENACFVSFFYFF